MQARHLNKGQYFTEQSVASEKYIFPYINDVLKISSELFVAEVGCGYGGNLKPFLDCGCRAVGIDINKTSIEAAEMFYEGHPNRKNLQLILQDIFVVDPNDLPKFDIIFLRDTFEHINDHNKFLLHIKSFLKTNGKLFMAFPPWCMPFGGHQQVCSSKFLSNTPYFHILPKFLYRNILKLFGETEEKIISLLEVRDTRIYLQRFYKYVEDQGYKVEKQTFYLINPNYEVKFGMKPRILPKLLNIPYFRDFVMTTYYCILYQNISESVGL